MNARDAHPRIDRDRDYAQLMRDNEKRAHARVAKLINIDRSPWTLYLEQRTRGHINEWFINI
jgi:hypothetical protein